MAEIMPPQGDKVKQARDEWAEKRDDRSPVTPLRQRAAGRILSTPTGGTMKRISLFLITALSFTTSCAQGGAAGGVSPAPEFEVLTPYGPPTRPFSPAVRVGNLIFLSGQIGTTADAAGGLVAGGIEAETRQTMENIKDVLTRVGSSMDRVVKCTVMMADMAEWPRMNTVYATYFPNHKPARSAFGATALALGARVEIECIAVTGASL